MRILSIHNSADIYGASRCIERLAKRLNSDGHRLFVVLPRDGPLKKLLEAAGARVILHPALSVLERHQMRSVATKLRFALELPISVFWLTLLIVRLRVDVVHTNCATMPSSPFAAALTGRPHVWHIRECFVDFPFLWKYYQHLIYKLSREVIAISKTVKEQFDSRLHEKITVVYDGLPSEEFQPCSPDLIREFRTRFDLRGNAAAVIGRIKWLRKGQEVFVRAAALLKTKYPDAKFLIVGSSAPGNEEHSERLHRLVDELGLASQVVFTGDIDNVRPVFASVDLVVVPSVQPEPLGLVVMESMAMGTPVIGSRSGGIAEQVRDGVEGCLFQPGNEIELASAMDRLFSDSELRREMGIRARQRFVECFDIEESYRGFLAACEGLRPLTPPYVESTRASE
jgi:glycosyltransferase involved in cell wall biosynthesis